jgi:hypothetical protein
VLDLLLSTEGNTNLRRPRESEIETIAKPAKKRRKRHKEELRKAFFVNLVGVSRPSWSFNNTC